MVDGLLDSGAAGYFLSREFADKHQLALTPCTSRLAVEALDGHPIGEGRITHITNHLQMQTGLLHQETLQFISSPVHPLILGLPWLRRHDPSISWRSGEIIQWCASCQQDCIQPKSFIPLHAVSVTTPRPEVPGLPEEYADLYEAFSKAKASQLPPHRSWDCAIDLLPDSTPPKGRIFPLSHPEADAMKKYIEEELAKGFIRPSTSPASAGFFFVKKKDGGLRPCIDYRGLNDITVKFRYPLSLVPAALEQLRQAKYFTKLDLRSAYNLIQIREVD